MDFKSKRKTFLDWAIGSDLFFEIFIFNFLSLSLRSESIVDIEQSDSVSDLSWGSMLIIDSPKDIEDSTETYFRPFCILKTFRFIRLKLEEKLSAGCSVSELISVFSTKVASSGWSRSGWSKFGSGELIAFIWGRSLYSVKSVLSKNEDSSPVAYKFLLRCSNEEKLKNLLLTISRTITLSDGGFEEGADSVNEFVSVSLSDNNFERSDWNWFNLASLIPP